MKIEYVDEFKFCLLLFEFVFITRYFLKAPLKFQSDYAAEELIEATIYC